MTLKERIPPSPLSMETPELSEMPILPGVFN